MDNNQKLINKLKAESYKYAARIEEINSFLSRIQARVFENLPGKLFTMDNYESLQIDSCSDEGFKGSSSVEDIIPQYLNIKLKHKRFEKLRKKSGRG